jgi:cephalosporin-C deacetylase-like acetyl esterase
MPRPAYAQLPQTPQEVLPGVTAYMTTIRNSAGGDVALWVFLPSRPAGKVGCVVIAPAGTPEVYGSRLGNLPEYLPYVQAGFAVIAYSLDGPVKNRESLDEIVAAHKIFRRTYGGLYDAAAAIDYAVTALPQVDPKRIYAAGHSSAGAVALFAAEYDPRIKGCLAYAPRTDLVNEKQDIIQELKPRIPDIANYLAGTSPTTWYKRLHCPLFLFSAADDSVVAPQSVAAFAAKVSTINAHVTFVRVRSGDHYDSMIHEGLPRGVAWLQALDMKVAAGH